MRRIFIIGLIFWMISISNYAAQCDGWDCSSCMTTTSCVYCASSAKCLSSGSACSQVAETCSAGELEVSYSFIVRNLLSVFVLLVATCSCLCGTLFLSLAALLALTVTIRYQATFIRDSLKFLKLENLGFAEFGNDSSSSSLVDSSHFS